MVSVTDGDTLRVRLSGDRASIPVRLLGIDTPETRRPRTGVECGGREASASLKQLALNAHARGRRVSITSDPTQDRVDRYGRLLAYVRPVGGRELNVMQVRRGWGEHYVFAGRPVARAGALQRAERAARDVVSGVTAAAISIRRRARARGSRRPARGGAGCQRAQG